MATVPTPILPSFSPLSSSPPQFPTTPPSPPSTPPPPPPLPPSLHPDISFWKERVKDWYPRWTEKPYFVPPVQLNRIYHTTQKVSGQEVTVREPPVPIQPSKGPPMLVSSDVRDDQTQQHVLHYLHRLLDNSSKAILILSQLRYEDYLSKPSFHAAAQMLPRSVDLKKEGKDRGDFDVLIIHSRYGIVQCEVKSVGELFPTQSLTADQQDSIVDNRVKRAITQLQKGRDVLQHLVTDVAHPPGVHSTLMLPHISRVQLQRVLEARPELKQGLCDCLGIAVTKDPLDLCVTSDMLPPVSRPYDVTDDVIKHLADWWETLMMMAGGEEPAMSEDLYLELFARFAGPATTVRISQNSTPRLHTSNLRTSGQAVAEVGDRFLQIMLTPRQVSVLHADLPLVFLTGPPGTGKTVALVLKALEWLRGGEEVHVCSTWYKSLAASCSIVQQLRHMAGEVDGQRVILHKFKLSRQREKGAQEAAATLTSAAAAAKSSGLHVIADEAYFDCDTLFSDFCNLLYEHFTEGLRLWAASLNHAARPDLLVEIPLTEPLRTPPAVMREVAQCERMKDGTVYEYTVPLSPLPCDGPQPFFLYHEGEGHSESRDGPLSCQQCGRRLAEVLVTELGVGVAVPSPQKEEPNHQPAALRYSDVVILISRQPRGTPMSDSVGLVEGLKERGLPVRVIKRRDCQAVEEVATMEGPDHIVLAEQSDVYGLERKVVAWLQTSRAWPDGHQGRTERWGRLYAMSRSSAQLVCVLWPAGSTADAAESEEATAVKA